jgi:hypothetical protein
MCFSIDFFIHRFYIKKIHIYIYIYIYTAFFVDFHLGSLDVISNSHWVQSRR